MIGNEQFCNVCWRDQRVHRQVIQMVPRCPHCGEPYSINLDGTNVKGATPGHTTTAECGKCGKAFKYILFRTHYQETPDIPIFNGLTAKDEDGLS